MPERWCVAREMRGGFVGLRGVELRVAVVGRDFAGVQRGAAAVAVVP